MLYQLGEHRTVLQGSGHFIAPGAAVVGRVVLEENVSIWFNSVLRGDGEGILVGANSNVQDFAMLHTDPGYPLVIGRSVTIGHHAVVHGCTVGDGSLIGIGAIVLNGARIGQNCLVGAGALVPEGMEVPDGSLVMGMPAKVRRTLEEDARRALEEGARHYVRNGKRFLQTMQADSRWPLRGESNDEQ